MTDIVLPEYRIWEYASNPQPYNSDPRGLDYIRGLNIGVHTHRRFVKGEKVAESVYSEYDGETYSNLLVSVSIQYLRDDGVLKSKLKTYKWALIGEGDKLAEIEKISHKFCTVTDASVADQ